MGYVAVTAGFFALGSYLGRTLSGGWAILVSAPRLAASIFLDALNVFLFFLRIFSRGD
jgi:hypothetical protein